jgi:hypothetical protein
VLADRALISPRGGLAALGELAHLRGHDGEAAPVLARRAASTAALSARRSVWRAISCTTMMRLAMVRMPRRRRHGLPEARASAADLIAMASVSVAFLGVLLDVGRRLLHRARPPR